MRRWRGVLTLAAVAFVGMASSCPDDEARAKIKVIEDWLADNTLHPAVPATPTEPAKPAYMGLQLWMNRISVAVCLLETDVKPTPAPPLVRYCNDDGGGDLTPPPKFPPP